MSGEMELAGLEPATSWVRCDWSGAAPEMEKCGFAGTFSRSRVSVGHWWTLDWGAIIGDLGTRKAECPNGSETNLARLRALGALGRSRGAAPAARLGEAVDAGGGLAGALLEGLHDVLAQRSPVGDYPNPVGVGACERTGHPLIVRDRGGRISPRTARVARAGRCRSSCGCQGRAARPRRRSSPRRALLS
jgi:hypothetical protein